MSDIKCPICGNDLEQYHNGLVCYRHCLNGKNVWGGEETLKELIRTRKELEIAVDALKKIDTEFHKETMPDFAVFSDALKALDQINNIDKGE